jgi:hypothetical protein
VRGEEPPEREERLARKRSPHEWQELIEFGRRQHRDLLRSQEELRRGAAMLSDHFAAFRDQISRVILPGLQNDIDEVRRQIRRGELFAEVSARNTKKSRQSR